MDPEGRRGAWNMAMDHALAELLPEGEGAFRLYRWSPHTISFGRNEPARGRYDLEAAAEEGVAFVRRPTGGRAVFHAWEVTYCAVFGVRRLGSARDAYAGVNEGLAKGLRELGCPAELSAAGRALSPDAGPCFQAPAPGEVMAGGRKLVGSAQVRIGNALLQHGSVILRGDQSTLSRLAGGGPDPSPPATLDETARHIDWDGAAAAMVRGLALALGGRWAQGEATASEQRRAGELEADRYGTEAWTWRA